MTLYPNFIGIDIGKFTFFASRHGWQETKEYKNNDQGMKEFLRDHKKILSTALCILETTGGYEMELLYLLCEQKISVHRADTRKVKNFIRSYGSAAKTDRLDALALAKYGHARAEELALFVPPSSNSWELFQLTKRRIDLKKMVAAEKNRLQAPANAAMKPSFARIIVAIETELETVDKAIHKLIDTDPGLKSRKQLLITIPGIGEVTANQLLILLPELGTIDRRKIASLAGLAPISRDSGIYKGYRRTSHGRDGIKPTLFMAAMGARNSKSYLREFYEKLLIKGKKKKVALTAIMRRVLVIANAKMRDYYKENTASISA
jgi:transposase